MCLKVNLFKRKLVIRLCILHSVLLIIACQRTPFNEKLSTELIEMAKADQSIRDYLSKSLVSKDVNEKNRKKWDSINNTNIKRLKEIVTLYGWPGYDLVGNEGATAAWIIIQHADSNLEFQKQVLVLLEEAVINGDAHPIALAYLKDRVRILQRLPQIYGSQIDWLSDDSPKPYPIENEDDVDSRRLSIGLDSLSLYIKILKNM